MTIKVNPNTCPKCGATIPNDAPQGLCPKCVLLGAATPPEAGLSPTATADIPSLERVATAFPQLEILELLGRGGMGFVFKARQPHLDRFVALKLLPDKLARDPHFAERFSREARVLAKLNHPGIVSIYDFGQTGGFYFLLMEYVDGVNLRQAMQAGRFSPAAALAVVPKVCEALQYAHEQGVLHRDIKPANILLDTKGRVKIADFGIAKLVGEEKPDFNLTATGATIGTPQYMAPEQLEQPGTVDHRADIYSLGVVFYELLTGELPIGRFSPPSQRTPLDVRVDDVVMRTLEKDRAKRFQSAGDVKTKVEQLTEAGAGGSAADIPQPVAADFVLCHPRLPRMAQSLTVYALVIAPALWLVGLATMADTPHPNVYAAFVEAMLRLVTFWGGLLVTVLLFIGGWKLRALKKSGPRIIRAAVWLNLGFAALVILGVIWVEMLAPETQPAKVGFGEAVFTVTQFATVVFQIVVLFWLRRNRPVLDNIFQTAARPTGPRETIRIAPRASAAKMPSANRGGALKWACLALLVCAAGYLGLSTMLHRARNHASGRGNEVAAAPVSRGALNTTNSAPWIRFTFTAVELREVEGKRWLAIDYVDDVHGECQKAFPWETKIPGFQAQVRTSGFLKEEKDSPAVRHQRAEYLMPDSMPRDQLENLRARVETALLNKSVRLELGEQRTLFELGSSSDTALKAWIKVMPPLKVSP